MNKQPIRVLHIVPTLGYGGVAQFLLNYYKQMDKSLIIFDFVTHGGEESFHKELIDSGSKIFYLKSIGKAGLFGYLDQLKKIFSENKYDIVHTHDGHLTGVTAMLCKRYFPGAIFCHAHTTRCVNSKHRPFMPLFRFLSRTFGDMLLGCGIEACKFCYGKKSDFTVIHNAVSLERFWNVNQEDATTLRRELNIKENSFVIGHIGLFSPPKNHRYIIKLFQYVVSKHPEAILVLVGDGPMKDEIITLSKEYGIYENIRYVGIQQNIPLYMHIFDTFILPSLHEGLPVCAVEAQSVVSNVCISDTVDHDVDAGIGSVEFIPITLEAIPQWEQAVFAKKTKVSYERIKDCFVKHGYEIKSSVDTLFNVYKNYLSRG